MIVLHEFGIADQVSQLWVICDYDLRRAIDVVTDPQLRVVLLVCCLIELCTLWEGRDGLEVASTD